MPTSFFKPKKGVERIVEEVPFPDPKLPRLAPPRVRAFHPYGSQNIEFFPEPNNAFRNDHDPTEVQDTLGEPDDRLEFSGHDHEMDLEDSYRTINRAYFKRQLISRAGARTSTKHSKQAQKQQVR